MSDYRYEKVLRIPASKVNITNPWDCEDLLDRLGFTISPTTDHYIDKIIDSSYGDTAGEWGRARILSTNEKQKYYPLFKQLSENVCMSDVHLVEYCWYTCTEAPNYYLVEDLDDPFYDEV